MKKIKDPLRKDYTHIHEPFLSIIDTPEFQRLRRVKQLGLTHLVYPGATHTRFIHSLGTFNLTKKFISSLGSLSENEIRQLKFAALLHDIGHGPYSHVTERIDGTKDHENRSCEIVREFATRDLIPDSDVEPIIEFIKGERKPNIIHGDIDADRIDYLLRDSKNTGNESGVFEENTIIENAVLLPDRSLAFDSTALSALSTFPQSRQSMYSSVYMNPTVRIAETMLKESVEQSSINPHIIHTLDDGQLRAKLASESGLSNDLYTRLMNRDLYKIAYGIRNLESTTDIPDPDRLRHDIYTELSLNPSDVFVDTIPSSIPRISGNIVLKGQVYDFDEIVSQAQNSHPYNLQLAVYTKEEHTEKVWNFVQRELSDTM